jgi:hypothetical protein
VLHRPVETARLFGNYYATFPQSPFCGGYYQR